MTYLKAEDFAAELKVDTDLNLDDFFLIQINVDEKKIFKQFLKKLHNPALYEAVPVSPKRADETKDEYNLRTTDYVRSKIQEFGACVLTHAAYGYWGANKTKEILFNFLGKDVNIVELFDLKQGTSQPDSITKNPEILTMSKLARIGILHAWNHRESVIATMSPVRNKCGFWTNKEHHKYVQIHGIFLPLRLAMTPEEKVACLGINFDFKYRLSPDFIRERLFKVFSTVLIRSGVDFAAVKAVMEANTGAIGSASGVEEYFVAKFPKAVETSIIIATATGPVSTLKRNEDIITGKTNLVSARRKNVVKIEIPAPPAPAGPE